MNDSRPQTLTALRSIFSPGKLLVALLALMTCLVLADRFALFGMKQGNLWTVSAVGLMLVAFFVLLIRVNRAVPKSAGKDDYLRGMHALGRRQLDEAISSFTQAIQLDPESAVAYKHRGVAYLRKGEAGKAAVDFEKAAELGENILKMREIPSPKSSEPREERYDDETGGQLYRALQPRLSELFQIVQWELDSSVNDDFVTYDDDRHGDFPARSRLTGEYYIDSHYYYKMEEDGRSYVRVSITAHCLEKELDASEAKRDYLGVEVRINVWQHTGEIEFDSAHSSVL